MNLKVKPTTELALWLGDKKIGSLDALCLDLSSGGGFLGVPKVKLAITVNANAFDGDSKSLTSLIEKVSKFKFLDVTLRK